MADPDNMADSDQLPESAQALTEYGLTVRSVDGKGKGVFSNVSIEEGKVVFIEKKFVGMQSVASSEQIQTCLHCMKVLGTIEQLLSAHLPADTDMKSIASLADTESVQCTGIQCRNAKQGCDALFCSQGCQEASWALHHSLLCAGRSPATAEFLSFCRETNEVLLMAGQVAAHIVIQMKTGASLADAMKPFAHIKRELWWRTVQPPPDMSPSDAEEFRGSLQMLVGDASVLLKSALGDELAESKELLSIFEPEFWGRLMGMFELNQWSTCSVSPLQQYCRSHREHLQERPPGELQLLKDKVGDAVWTALEAAAEAVAEGCGLYLAGSLFNHSCTPNVALLKEEGHLDDTTAVRALTDISPGDELCISYIDEDSPLEEREQVLADYLFTCACHKCLVERGEISLV